MDRRLTLVAVLALLLASVAAGGAHSSEPLDDASISGIVTAADTGDALTGFCVFAEGIGHQGEVRGASAEVDDAGAYELTELAPGDWRIIFYPCGDHLEAAYPPTWYDGVATYGDATPVTVTAGEQRTSIDAALPRGGRITGRLVAADTGDLLPAGCVDVHHVDPGKYGFIPMLRYADAESFTSAALHPGRYVVRAEACGEAGEPYVSLWYEGVRNRGDATVIEVEAEATRDLGDVVLPRGGAIAGQVRDSVDGHPVADCRVRVTDDGGAFVGYETADADGRYVAQGLHGGTYHVQIRWCNGYLPRWFDGAETLEEATAIPVGLGEQVADIDVDVVPMAEISGRITTVSGHAQHGLCATLYDADGEALGSDAAYGSEQSYSFRSLRPGAYTVKFDGCEQEDGYLSSWFGGALTRDGAQALQVGPGDHVTDVNGQVARPASIAGTVTSAATGDPVDGACVRLVADDPAVTAGTSTADDGRYQVDGLWPASYRVRAAGCSPYYLPRYFDGAATSDAATLVAPDPGATVRGADIAVPPATTIDLAPADADRWVLDGTHTVTVTATTAGEPAQDVPIHITVSGANSSTGTIVTGADGTVTFTYDNEELTGGRDTITATVDLDEDGERDPFEVRRHATVEWTLLPPF